MDERVPEVFSDQVQSEADKLAWGEIGRHFKEYWQHAPNRIEVILLARLFGDPCAQGWSAEREMLSEPETPP